MKVDDAKTSAVQIFEEERRYPTVAYSPIPRLPKAQADDVATLRELIAHQRAENLLAENRAQVPHILFNGEDRFQFEARNYNLLVALFGRVDGSDRAEFLNSVAKRIDSFPGCAKSSTYNYLSYGGQTSELPLVAEFLIRNSGRTLFFDTIRQSQPSPAVAMMLLGLSDVIALNYPIFSEAEYTTLSGSIGILWKTTYDTLNYIRTYGHNLDAAHWGQFGLNGSAICMRILELCNSVAPFHGSPVQTSQT
jgi:hypothetical protein